MESNDSLDCIGEDYALHKYNPNEDYALCGVAVRNKVIPINDSVRFACPECSDDGKYVSKKPLFNHR